MDNKKINMALDQLKAEIANIELSDSQNGQDDSRINNIETDLNNAKAQIHQNTSKLNSVSTSISNLEGQVSNIPNIQTSVAENSKQIINNSNNITLLDSQLSTTTNDLNQSIQVINNSINSNNQSIQNISSLLTTKVDKEDGKILSTNDYTNEDKTKLAEIEHKAQVNVQSDWNTTDENSDAYIKNKPDLSNIVTTDSAQTITGAKTFEVDGTKEFALKTDGWEYIPIKFYENDTSLGGLAMRTTDSSLYAIPKIGPSAKILNANMLENGAFKDNPMPITSGGVFNALNNYAPTSALDGKVDKVDGKQLSTNDYTDIEKEKLQSLPSQPATQTNDGLMSSTDKSKLDGIAEGAEVNVQSDWNVTDTSSKAFIKNKPFIPQGSILYDTTGQSTIGAMTQKATTDLLNNTESLINQNTLLINNLESEIENVAKKDLSNVTYPQIIYNSSTKTFDGSAKLGAGDRVVESYVSTNGKIWYRKWASGWKECGGMFTASGSVGAGSDLLQPITLPITFNDINYITSATPIWLASGGARAYMYVYNKDKTQNVLPLCFQNNTGSAIPSGAVGCQWYCCGY